MAFLASLNAPGAKVALPVGRLSQALFAASAGLQDLIEHISPVGLGQELPAGLGHGDGARSAPGRSRRLFDVSDLLGFGEAESIKSTARIPIEFMTAGGVASPAPSWEMVTFRSPAGPLVDLVAPASGEARKTIGWLEAGGAALALFALIGLMTYMFDSAARAPTPLTTVTTIREVQAPIAALPAALDAVASPATLANPTSEIEVAASETLTPVQAAATPSTPDAQEEAAGASAASPPADDVATSAVLPQPLALPAADLLPSTFEFSAVDGKIHMYGLVADARTRAALLDDLKAVYGADAIIGVIAIDARRAPAAWLAKLPVALKSLKAPGLFVLFSGEDIALGGRISDAERGRLSSALAGLSGGDVKVVALADHLRDVSARANAHVAASLAALRPGFSASDLVSALNLSIINFGSSSADIPENDRALLSKAATLFKQLAPGASIEIAGYTDKTGGEDQNVPLSRRRAEAVRAALVKDGVSAATLFASGHGGADPIASNKTVEGRFRNRRIEYRLATAKVGRR